MDNLLKEIRRVQRRLAFQHFLGILGWCWLVALAGAAIAIGAARIWPFTAKLHVHDWHWLAGFLAAGLAAAILWTVFRVTPPIRAALEIDRRCGLKERVSSTLAMNDLDRQSEAGQAVIADADAKLRRTAVAEQFPIRPPRNLLLPLAPAALALAVIFLWSPAEPKVDAAATANKQQPAVEIKKSVEDMRQKLAERRKEAEKENLPDATELLKKLEQETTALKSQDDREKALVKLNDLARELQERRKQLGGGGEAMKHDLDQIQKFDFGPADKLAKAMSKGDFDKAAQELEKLQKQMADGATDPAKKNDLAKQMEQLKQKIDQMAKQAKDAQADLRQRADQMKQPGGDKNAASKLEEQIQKFQQQGPQMDALKNLANKLGQAAQQMKQGKNGQAAQSMQQALQQMQQMAKEQNEMKALDGAMQTLADARRQMTCEKCGGKGCKECQGNGTEMEGQMAGMGQGEGDKDDNGKPGFGLGGGKGDGRRPEAKADAKFYDSRVRQKVGKGGAIITGMTGGPNLKNQAEAEIQEATTAIEHGSTDPLSGQRLPKKQSENAREYFDSFREGK